MRLYTGKGDQGSTDLLGERVGKDDPRIGLIGSLDEATSQIGLGRAVATSVRTKEWLTEVQRDLYRIMAELAFSVDIRPEQYVLLAERVTRLEVLTDQLSAEVPLPPHFILPGDTLPGAALDVARTVVRRAEREAVSLAQAGVVTNPEVLRYLNRLSSLLFMLARFEDREAGVTPLRAKDAGNV
ncbi:MAG: cob(I)yrinic acid a,c-diamide adenosyltransferase [Thermomicrobiales bacterium]